MPFPRPKGPEKSNIRIENPMKMKKIKILIEENQNWLVRHQRTKYHRHGTREIRLVVSESTIYIGTRTCNKTWSKKHSVSKYYHVLWNRYYDLQNVVSWHPTFSGHLRAPSALVVCHQTRKEPKWMHSDELFLIGGKVN